MSWKVIQSFPGYDSAGRRANEHNLRQKVFTQYFPSPLAGAPVVHHHQPGDYAAYEDSIHAAPNNSYTPFRSKSDWEFARWAKLRKVGVNTLNALLKIESLCESLDLSFHTAHELNHIIDGHLLERRPHFK